MNSDESQMPIAVEAIVVVHQVQQDPAYQEMVTRMEQAKQGAAPQQQLKMVYAQASEYPQQQQAQMVVMTDPNVGQIYYQPTQQQQQTMYTPVLMAPILPTVTNNAQISILTPAPAFGSLIFE